MSTQGLPSDINLRSMGLYFIEDETERAVSRLNDSYISQMLVLAVWYHPDLLFPHHTLLFISFSVICIRSATKLSIDRSSSSLSTHQPRPQGKGINHGRLLQPFQRAKRPLSRDPRTRNSHQPVPGRKATHPHQSL